MRIPAMLTLAAAGAVGLLTTPQHSQAQISVNIGPAPERPDGCCDYSPYACAPHGYYGPEWFADGAFIGAGPWFHGPERFHGYVDNHFRPENGYRGHMARGEPAEEGRHISGRDFHGNEMRDGRGHAVK